MGEDKGGYIVKKEYESPEVYIQEVELEGAICGDMFSGWDGPVVGGDDPE